MSIARDKTKLSNESLKQLQADSKIRPTRASHGSREGSPTTSSDNGSERRAKRRNRRSYGQPSKLHADKPTSLPTKVTPQVSIDLITPQPSPTTKHGNTTKTPTIKNSTPKTGSGRKRAFMSRESTPPPTIFKAKKRRFENEQSPIQHNSKRHGHPEGGDEDESFHAKLKHKLLSLAAQSRKV